MNLDDYRRAARRQLPRVIFDFIDGGADAEDCVRRNIEDLGKVTLLPRQLRDVSSVDTSVSLFGHSWKSPVALAPTGFNGLLRPGADIVLARAADQMGTPFILSTASNVPLEQIARQANGIRWLQLYIMGGRRIAEQLIRRARNLDYSALVLTVDVAVGGHRERDVRNGMTMPFKPSLRTMLDFGLHPSWALRFMGKGPPKFANLEDPDQGSHSAELAVALGNRQMDRSMAWDNLAWLREHWDGPLLLKGILHPDDARRAVGEGVDGLIVSNHGGRQLDVVPSTIQALPGVLDAVAKAIPVLVDGGFRRGGDIAKALAMGAKAVLVGRPALWGLAVAGEAGVRNVLETFNEELSRTMALLGATQVEELSANYLNNIQK
ncbi:alpha-hydroxy acid oxidase [Eoetvoesiella caeni]|uniref:alpha-hydroxy acid oxidase n=1 Tax=Eoetvoesiella caeni TaxID=645616 RepID=UPI001F5A85AD|nr:alpha-hydroxy acid oxidase [Eoetvoesiella caeni]MCI2806990.1 alpha-hydroxy-acid oxidizing protein [Eoetvoesiella caeni]